MSDNRAAVHSLKESQLFISGQGRDGGWRREARRTMNGLKPALSIKPLKDTVNGFEFHITSFFIFILLFIHIFRMQSFNIKCQPQNTNCWQPWAWLIVFGMASCVHALPVS